MARRANLVTVRMMSSWSVNLVEHPAIDAYQVALNLARNHHHRRRGGVGGVQSGGRVEQPWPRHYQRGPDTAAGAGEAVGHVGGGLLVPGGDEPDAWLVIESVHCMIKLHSGQSEHHPHALAVERFHQCLSAGHLSHSFILFLNEFTLGHSR